MIIFSWIIEVLFFSICGWVGHAFVKLITFGKVDLAYADPSEDAMAEWIGVGVLLLTAFGVSAALH